ncbi:MAG: polysaccharide biosynthesis tyrosine autokinase [Chloroflexi bacterium]|nr:polysaccharide biosynthesis tyrosine autokinase [Chloroflexota bacterium]
MEIKDYITMIRRWAWLLGIGLVVGALGGFLVSIFQTPIYQASTRILVLRASQAEKNTDTYLSDQQLVQTYIQLLTTRPVLEGASALLGFNVDGSQISVSQIRDVQAIQLTVQDANPQRAADIANIMVQVLIHQNEVIQTGRYTQTEESIQAQITQIENQITQMSSEIENVSTETVQQQMTQVEGQIASMQAEVTQLQNDIRQLTPPTTNEQQLLLSEKQARLNQVEPVLALSQQIYADLLVLGRPSTGSEDTTSRLSQLQTTLKLYQEIYINLLNNLEAIRLARLQNTPNVVSIEAAVVPSRPVRPNPVTNTALSAIVGLLLAGGIAFLVEYVDDTIRTPDDIERILKLPVIGYIGDIQQEDGEAVDVHVLKHPRSPVSEAFRSLRTNLEFTNVDRALKKILITSTGPGEGKTMIAVNLAAIIAQGGKRVLLLDADMRRPRVHKIFGISNRVGLSTLFRGHMTVRSAMRTIEGMENVFVITSGSLPPNPAELLASARMDQILLEASESVDVIVVDSPPSLVADFQVLATKLDGVLMVVQPGHTHADAAYAMMERLGRVDGSVLGVVLNKIPRDSHFYGGYYHNKYYVNKRGDYYYQSEDENPPQLEADRQLIKLLPQAQERPVENLRSPQHTTPDSFSSAFTAREPVETRTAHDESESFDPAFAFEGDVDGKTDLDIPETVESVFESRKQVVMPQQEVPASVEIITKPRKQPNEGLRMAEAPSYTIKRYKLEYWYDDDETRKK